MMLSDLCALDGGEYDLESFKIKEEQVVESFGNKIKQPGSSLHQCLKHAK